MLDLNGWVSTTNSWQVDLTNQGIINKNNGAVQFTFSSGTFVNQAGGVWNVNSGTWNHGTTLGVQQGSITVSSGATLNSTNALNFSGTAITNNGAITTTSVAFVGSTAQQLGGNGSINTLNINNANGVDLIGDQQVNNTLAFTDGRINAPTNALVLAPGATVAGANASRYVNGAVRWNYPTGSNVSRVFPIGDASVFTPLTLRVRQHRHRWNADCAEHQRRSSAGEQLPDQPEPERGPALVVEQRGYRLHHGERHLHLGCQRCGCRGQHGHLRGEQVR